MRSAASFAAPFFFVDIVTSSKAVGIYPYIKKPWIMRCSAVLFPVQELKYCLRGCGTVYGLQYSLWIAVQFMGCSRDKGLKYSLGVEILSVSGVAVHFMG